MSDNIARKKSQRWVSASATNYDGADWESDISSSDAEEQVINKLPSLPKLSLVPNEAEVSGAQETPSSDSVKANSRNISLRSTSKSVNEDLDTLMNQISQEMTPKHDPVNNNSDNENSSANDEDVDMKVSKSGYFAALIDEKSEKRISFSDEEPEPNAEKEQIDASNSDKSVRDFSPGETHSIVHSADEAKDKLKEGNLSGGDSDDLADVQVHDIADSVGDYFKSAKETDQLSDEKSSISQEHNSIVNEEYDEGKMEVQRSIEPKVQEQNESDVHHILNDYESDVSGELKDDRAVLRKTSKTDLSYRGDYSSDETEDDQGTAISEVSLHKLSNNSEGSFKFRNRVRDSVLDSSDDDLQYSNNDEDLKVSEKGYFANIVQENGEPEVSDHGNSTSEEQGPSTQDQDDDTNSIADSITKSLSQASLTKTVTNGTASADDDIGYESAPTDDNKKLPFSTRESLNLGKWKPDTDAFRSGFVTETIDVKNPPEGYIVTEDGEIVEDKTPSDSAIGRNYSISSDTESAWNAFPQGEDDSDDLNTIADTKTIYDNQTLYNVPAVIANNVAAPALPKNIQLSTDTEFISSNDTILKHINGEVPHTEPRLKESFSSEKNDNSLPTLNSKIPQFDVNKLLASNEPHPTKLKKLNDYEEQMKEFDTGLQAWIQYALKSSNSADKDFIFKDYKVSKHVQDAYAHAENLSKKNSVANTVNQNVTHLKKKMFSSSMRQKSKGLFSSIGKKL